MKRIIMLLPLLLSSACYQGHGSHDDDEWIAIDDFPALGLCGAQSEPVDTVRRVDSNPFEGKFYAEILHQSRYWALPGARTKFVAKGVAAPVEEGVWNTDPTWEPARNTLPCATWSVTDAAGDEILAPVATDELVFTVPDSATDGDVFTVSAFHGGKTSTFDLRIAIPEDLLLVGSWQEEVRERTCDPVIDTDAMVDDVATLHFDLSGSYSVSFYGFEGVTFGFQGPSHVVGDGTLRLEKPSGSTLQYHALSLDGSYELFRDGSSETLIVSDMFLGDGQVGAPGTEGLEHVDAGIRCEYVFHRI